MVGTGGSERGEVRRGKGGVKTREKWSLGKARKVTDW